MLVSPDCDKLGGCMIPFWNETGFKKVRYSLSRGRRLEIFSLEEFENLQISDA
jgi:hypothetical protein